MDYILIFHSNLNYSQLRPEKREFVCRESYERLNDFFSHKFPEVKWCFEASGFTIDYMAEHTPDVLEKLKYSISQKKCEFIGSPYAHSILTNFPEEDGVYSLEFSLESYQKHLGVKPATGWNPEGCWNQRIPEMFKKVGYKILITDWDSYLKSNDETIKKEESYQNKVSKDGLKYLSDKIDPADKTLHFPMQIIPGLKGVMRTDRVSAKTLYYFQGDFEFEELSKIIDKFSSKNEGFLVVYAEDAEYLGTTAWYYLKYHNKFKFFEKNPESFDRLERLMEFLLNRGNLITVSEAVEKYQTLNISFHIDDGFAWHNAYAIAWASTPWAKELDKECDKVRKKIKEAEKKIKTEEEKERIRKAWFYLVQAENSDGRWPPPPFKPGEFNVQYCKDMLKKAEILATSILG